MKPSNGSESLYSSSPEGIPIPAYLANFAEISFNAVIAFDAQRQVTYWNPAAEQLYGWKAGEVLGKTFAELFWPLTTPQGQEDQRQKQTSLDSGEILQGEYQPHRKDGSLIWVEYTLRSVSNGEGGISGYVAVHRDISEHKQIPEKLERKRIENEIELAAKMSAENPNPIMRMTPDGHVVYANDASRPLLEFWMRHTGQTISDEIQTAIREAFESGSKKVLEIEYDGKTLFCTLAPIREAGYVNFYGADITERKGMEQSLRDSEERAHLLTKVGEFVRHVADPDEFLYEVAEAVGEHLHAQRSFFVEIDQANDRGFIRRDYCREALSVAGDYRLSEYSAETTREMEAGRTVVNSDSKLDPRTAANYDSAYALHDERAYIAVPLMREERWVAALWVSTNIPRDWGLEEVILVETVAERAWLAVEKMRLDREIRRALSELQMTYDQSPIGMIQLDTDLRYIRLNETLALYNGIPAADHIGRSIQEIVPDLAPKIEDGFRKVMETGEPVFNVEVVGETKAEPGVPHTWLESWYPLRDKSSKVVGLNIVVQDITERKQAEEALRLAHERTRQSTDRIARLQKVTAALSESLTPLRVAEVVVDQGVPALGAVSGTMMLLAEDGQTLEIMYTSASENLARTFRRIPLSLRVPATDAVRSGQPVWIESKQLYLELYPHLAEHIAAWGYQTAVAIPMVDKGRTLGTLNLSFDKILPHIPENQDYALTLARQGAQALERAHSEAALRESEERYRLVAETATDAIISIDENSIILFANRAAGTIFGYPVEQLIGQSLTMIMPEDLREQHKVGIARYRKTGKRNIAWERMEVPARHADGRVFPLEVSFGQNHQGSKSFFIGVARDITERKSAEQALRESEKQLQYLNETLEQKVEEQTAEMRKLASDLTKAEQRERHRIAHILHEDLQQRFYAIQMQMELLLDGIGKDDAAVQRDFAQIKEQLKNAVAITRHLSVNLSPPILRDEGLTQALEWLASQMQELHGLHVELRAEGSFAIPDEDVQMFLFNCVRELLFNIVKHAGVNQAVVALEQSNADLRIEVRDEGNGFDVAALAWQASKKVNEDEPGQRSFGLPTLRHQLSLFGGQMDINSEPGVGTLITITIPNSQTPA